MRHASDMAAAELPPETANAQRRHHNKSRTGCRLCKTRRVRCDEARPSCAACQWLRLDCHYVDPKPRQRKKKKYVPVPVAERQLRALVPALSTPAVTPALITPDDTARAIVFATFGDLDPMRTTRCGVFGPDLAQQSVPHDCFRFLCVAIKDLSRSGNPALRQHGFLPLGQPQRFLDSCTFGRDKHLFAAATNYGRALATFREALPTMAPRDIAYGTFLLSTFETLRGDAISGGALMTAGVSMLRPCVEAPPPERGRARYGIDARDRSMAGPSYVEAVAVRWVALSILGGFSVGSGLLDQGEAEDRNGSEAPSDSASPPVSDLGGFPKRLGFSNRGGAGNCRQDWNKRKVPAIKLPTESLPAPGDDDTIETLRSKWNDFQSTLEYWYLSRYWAIAVGQPFDSMQHLSEQSRLQQHMDSWHRILEGYVEINRGRYAQDGVSFAARAEDEHAVLVERAIPSTTRLEHLIHQEIDEAALTRLVEHGTNEIDGFRISDFNGMLFDLTMLPMMTLQASRQVAAGLEAGQLSNCSPREHGQLQLRQKSEQAEAGLGAYDVGLERPVVMDMPQPCSNDTPSHHDGDDNGNTDEGLEMLLCKKQLALLELEATIERVAFEEQERQQELELPPRQTSTPASHTLSMSSSASMDGDGTSRGPLSNSSSPPLSGQPPSLAAPTSGALKRLTRREFQVMPLRTRKGLTQECTALQLAVATAALLDGKVYTQVVA
ncbi:hypothetical protein Micbo1qcDRAFT_211436 [Microdochium bolleyi]|uniref:Zn(2)-C6 fungal-type domain-containing protein n=1 Tax=Microdochium bolleyi TaxID=196109 RepID=A0A136JJ19_9PEZI|nr:hypothetical protein Micbo1qcDRAFT_211436 [Microdochium bolleyi]